MPRPNRRTLRLRAPGLSWRLLRLRKVIGGPWAASVEIEERARDVSDSWERLEVRDASDGVASLTPFVKREGEGRRPIEVALERHRVDAETRVRAAIMIGVSLRLSLMGRARGAAG